jgi:D-aminopeptidase
VTPGAYDAVAVVGMHAKTGSRGFASHTLTLGIGVVINERVITETELVGLSWGARASR